MWIECGIINYKLIIPFIYPIFHPIRILIHKEEEKPILESFIAYIGYLLNGFIYLIIKYRMRKKVILLDENKSTNEIKPIILELNNSSSSILEEGKENRRNKINSIINEKIIKKEINQIDLKRKDLEKKESKRKHLFIFILSIIYLIPMHLNAFNPYSFKMGSSASLLFAIISYVLFSKVILGMKIYSHQIFSLIIILVSNIITILLELVGNGGENIFLSLLFIFIIVTLFGLYNILVKKYFNTVYTGSPYYFMFMIGLFSICIILIYETITVSAFGKNAKFNGLFYQIEKNFQEIKLYPLIFIADIIAGFFLVAGIILTIYFFTPCHFIISESISQILASLVRKNLMELSITKQVIIYILFVVILLGGLIFNEIFIINICSLSKNTKKHISQRQKEETENIISNNILLS